MSRERLEHCFHQCAERAWRLACAMVGDPHWAADCVQSAFVAAARKPALVPANPWPWFSTVLVNEVRNQRRKRRPQPSSEELEMLDPTPGPARKAEQSETAGELRLALETLPEAERDAISLTFIGGLSRAEAAQSLAMPVKTLNSHVNRGIERLRRRLNHREETLMAALLALPAMSPAGGWDSALAGWKAAAFSSGGSGIATAGGIMANKVAITAGFVLALGIGFGGGAGGGSRHRAAEFARAGAAGRETRACVNGKPRRLTGAVFGGCGSG